MMHPPLCRTGILFALLFLSPEVSAEVATDGTVGPAGTLPGPDYQIPSTLGTVAGDNLFHSFATFGLKSGESATFTGPGHLANVISRVTGGEASHLNGLLRSEVGRADFFFINPAGIFFGPDAGVDVPAAFHASTADALTFDDGRIFSAADPGRSSLSMSGPASFGYLSPQPASIIVSGSRLTFVPESHISLDGGDVFIRDGAVLAGEGSEIRIRAAGQFQGQVELDTQAPESFAGTVSLSDSAGIDVSGAMNGGAVVLQAGLIKLEQAEIAADHSGENDSSGRIFLGADRVRVLDSDVGARVLGAGRGSDIEVKAEELEVDGLTAANGGSYLMTRVGAGVGGRAGDVEVEADRIVLSSGGQVGSIVETGATGCGGNVVIAASDAVTIEGSNEAGYFSGIGTTVLSASGGRGGSVLIDSPGARLEMSDGAFLQSGTAGPAAAGDIMLKVRSLKMTGGSQILSSTYTGGDAGAIVLAVGKTAVLEGSSIYGHTAGPGDAGLITISADAIEIREGQINVSSSNAGRAGQVWLDADASVTLADYSAIEAYSGSLYGDATGEAGRVKVETGIFTLQDSAIDVFSYQRANAGTIEISADEIRMDLVQAAGQSENAYWGLNASNSGGWFADVFPDLAVEEEGRSGTIRMSAAQIVLDHGVGIRIPTSVGNGGSVSIEADELDILNGAGIFSQTSGPGRGGEVEIAVSGELVIEGGIARNGYTSPGGISTSPVVLDPSLGPSETGPAGAITIAADSLIVGRDAQILSGSFSNAPAGPVTLDIGSLEVREGGEISSSAGAEGPGADIRIRAGRQVVVHGADPVFLDVSTIKADAGFSTAGGDGGSVQIESPELVVKQGGEISSSAFGGGAGGRVGLVARDLEVHSGGKILTSTSGSAPAGSIDLAARTLDINGEGEENQLFPWTGLFSETTGDAAGSAGIVDVAVDESMALRGGAQVSTATSSGGRAGDVNIAATDLLVESGEYFWQVSSISSGASSSSTGRVGRIKLETDAVIIDGGEISIAANQVLPEGDARPGTEGSIRIDAARLRMRGGGRITAESTGNVPAGAIELAVADTLSLENSSRITTLSHNADGGPVTIKGRMIFLNDGLITTSVEGLAGDGGDITVQGARSPADILILGGGFVQANTAAEGARGGDILIDSRAVIAGSGLLEVGGLARQVFEPGSGVNVIQAAAPGGERGTIAITAPNLDISGSLVGLAPGFSEEIMPATDPCLAAAGATPNSLIRDGRGGLSVDAGGPLTVVLTEEKLEWLLKRDVGAGNQEKN